MFRISPMLRRLSERIEKRREIAASGAVDVDGIETVCLALGPYRNLTTLTAAVLHLHPNCRVLNHAGVRIFGDRRLDFLAEYSDRTFGAFTKYALHISQSGTRGDYGGSITHSHAFDAQYALGNLARDGEAALGAARALFWKESLRTSNRMRNCGIDLDDVFARNDRLRFLMPVRNPLDCAVSNMKTGHMTVFESLHRDSSIEDLVDALLDEYAWFEGLRRRHPDRFLAFFAHEIGPETLQALERFLRLPTCEEWHEKALAAFDVRKRYDHDEGLISHFRERVAVKLADHPEFAAKLIRFYECGGGLDKGA